jgi:hypothetical protein
MNALVYLRMRWTALLGALIPLLTYSPRPPSVGVYRALMSTKPAAHAAVVTTLNGDNILEYVPVSVCLLMITL